MKRKSSTSSTSLVSLIVLLAFLAFLSSTVALQGQTIDVEYEFDGTQPPPFSVNRAEMSVFSLRVGKMMGGTISIGTMLFIAPPGGTSSNPEAVATASNCIADPDIEDEYSLRDAENKNCSTSCASCDCNSEGVCERDTAIFSFIPGFVGQYVIEFPITETVVNGTDTATFSDILKLVLNVGSPLTCPPDLTAYAPADSTQTQVFYPDPTGVTACSLQINCTGEPIPGFSFLGQLKGKSYYLSDSYKTWKDAQAHAKDLGGNLATVNDSATQQFLASHLGFADAAFIGLQDTFFEGSFGWISGEPFFFTNFDDGEPDFGNVINEDFVAMHGWSGGKWGDYNAFVHKRYILEISCFHLQLLDGFISGFDFPLGETTVRYLMTDACGQQATCEFTVTVEPDSECEDPENVALDGIATQSSTRFGAEANRARDGNTSGEMFTDNSVSHTEWEFNAWWEIDLKTAYELKDLRIWNRTDCCGEWLKKYYVLVSETPFLSTDLGEMLADTNVYAYLQPDIAGTPTTVPIGQKGRYVRIQLIDQGFIALAEVEITGCTGNSFAGGSNQAIVLKTANDGQGGVNLYWLDQLGAQAGEFSIERSADGENFEEVGQLLAHSGAAGQEFYSSKDGQPAPAVNFYRIAHRLPDGNLRYSNVAAAEFVKTEDFLPYPNPASGELFINLSSIEGKAAVLEIYDATATRQRFLSFGQAPRIASVRLDDLREGLYFIMLKSEGRRDVSKPFVVAKN